MGAGTRERSERKGLAVVLVWISSIRSRVQGVSGWT
jgi:hypothetical protein